MMVDVPRLTVGLMEWGNYEVLVVETTDAQARIAMREFVEDQIEPGIWEIPTVYRTVAEFVEDSGRFYRVGIGDGDLI
jgi:hypothetical protein